MKISEVTPPTSDPVSVAEAKQHLRAVDSDEDEYIGTLITAAREQVEDITRRALMTQTWDYFLDEWPDDDYITLPWGKLASVTSVKYKDSDGVETNLTKALSAFADSTVSSLTKTKVTSTAHGYADGDMVYISGTTSYNGAWAISNVTTNTFDITTAYVANDAAGAASTEYIVELNGDGYGKVVLPYGGVWPTDTLYTSNPITVRFVAGWASASLVPYKLKAAIKMICSDLYEQRGEPVVGIGQNVIENQVVNRLLASWRLWGDF